MEQDILKILKALLVKTGKASWSLKYFQAFVVNTMKRKSLMYNHVFKAWFGIAKTIGESNNWFRYDTGLQEVVLNLDNTEMLNLVELAKRERDNNGSTTKHQE